jgi:hypothetical protein
VFDWDRIAVPLRKVQMLLNAGLIKTEKRAVKIGLAEPDPETGKAKPKKVKPEPEKAQGGRGRK